MFLSSGWLDPSVSPEAQLAANSSTVSPPESRAIVTGLMAFSTYEIRVVSINMAGSATSVWTTARTIEGGVYSHCQMKSLSFHSVISNSRYPLSILWILFTKFNITSKIILIKKCWYMSSSKYMYYLYAIAKHDIEKNSNRLNCME